MCQYKKKKLCDKKSVKKDWIENIAIKYTTEMLHDDELISKLIDMAVELQKKAAQCYLCKSNSLTKPIRKIDINDDEQRQRLVDIFVNGIYLYDDKIVFIFN